MINPLWTLERRERRRVPRDDGPRVASLDEARLEGYWGMGFAWQLRPALAALACVLIAAYLQFRGAAGWLAILLYVVASLCLMRSCAQSRPRRRGACVPDYPNAPLYYTSTF